MNTAVSRRRSGEVSIFDPTKTHIKIAALDAAVEHAKKIQDWESLQAAVEDQIEEQAGFVAWWDGTVRSAGNPAKKGANLISAEERKLSMTEAEKATSIKNQQVSRWRRYLKTPEKYVSRLYGSAYDEAMGGLSRHGGLSGKHEWYTPPEIIERVHAVLGQIDLDPASSSEANKVVLAQRIFTEDDNGLEQDWAGRVFCNPPYSHPACKYFAEKLLESYRSDAVTAAIFLIQANTDLAYWHDLARAGIVCLTKGRIKFYNGVDINNPTLGQAIFYFGDNEPLFIDQFCDVGVIMRAEQ